LLVVALALGIAVDRYQPLAAEIWWLVSAAGIAGWWRLWRAGRDVAGSWMLLFSVLACGGAWHHDRWNAFGEDEIGLMVREEIGPIAVEGTALHSPRWVPPPALSAMRAIPKGDESRVMLRITAVRDGAQWRSASGLAALDCDGQLVGVHAGDRLRVMAQAARPQGPLNPGEFDVARHQRSERVLCRLFGEFPDSVKVVERGSTWSPRRALSEIRGSGSALLRRSINPRRATLASAILLGAREQLDPERNEGYLVTGTIHVLSISGLHVGILAWGFWMLLRTGLVPQRPAILAAMLLTIAYALLTDFQPPVVRAAVLVVTICVARLAGREAFGFNALAAAGLVVLAYHPASLFLAGPQLSFLAVAVMILASPLLMPRPILDPLDRLIAQSRPLAVRWLRALFGSLWRLWLTGAIIWLVSLPIVWQQYNLISPSALVINTIIWVPVTLALYGGFAALLLGWLVPPVAAVGSLVCDGNLWLMESIIAWGRELPGSYRWRPAPPWWWTTVFYVVLGLVAAVPRLRPRGLWWLALPAAWFAIALALASPSAKPGLADWPRRVHVAAAYERPLACSFVAVGHGIACVIELPDGRTILYDAGKLGSSLGAARPVSAVLWSRGIQHLDAIVISHADSDHFSGVPELLERFTVGAIYVSPAMFERPQPAVAELVAAIERSGVPLLSIHAGDRLGDQALRLEVLHPPRKGVIGSDNANSILLLVEHAGRRLLLTGDLESPGLEDVLAEEPLDCDVILAPHHGSRRSDPTGFSLWSTPEHVVISGGRNAQDIPDIESVKDSYRARGAEVYHTAEDGCVRVELRAGGVRVTTFRPRHPSWTQSRQH
jgi:competence protein ComEC